MFPPETRKWESALEWLGSDEFDIDRLHSCTVHTMERIPKQVCVLWQEAAYALLSVVQQTPEQSRERVRLLQWFVVLPQILLRASVKDGWTAKCGILKRNVNSFRQGKWKLLFDQAVRAGEAAKKNQKKYGHTDKTALSRKSNQRRNLYAQGRVAEQGSS